MDDEELSALLPSTYYMNPPYGGSVTILEQLQRMAKDAERYRWLRSTNNDWWEAGLVKLYDGPEFERLEGELLDAKVDAAMSTARAVGAA